MKRIVYCAACILSVALAAAAVPPPADLVNGQAAAQAGVYIEVESPWGFRDWYWVEPGENILRCSGTGNLFTYVH